MKCKKCGKEIEEDSKFCSNCGEPIKNEESKIIEAEIVETKDNNQENDKKTTLIKKDNIEETNSSKEVKQVEILEEKNEEKTGLSVTSLILGIIAILCVFEHGILNFTAGILAIIFGAIGRKKGAKGMGTTGMILGIASITLCIIVVIFLMIFASAVLFGLALN